MELDNEIGQEMRELYIAAWILMAKATGRNEWDLAHDLIDVCALLSDYLQ